MPPIESTIVFMPRFTTLIGSREFTTLPLDVSRFGSAQFQVWQAGINGSGGTFKVSFEESLDTEHWALGASSPEVFTIAQNETRFFSHSFRLRWFRLKVDLSETPDAMVTCWAEGILR